MKKPSGSHSRPGATVPAHANAREVVRELVHLVDLGAPHEGGGTLGEDLRHVLDQLLAGVALGHEQLDVEHGLGAVTKFAVLDVSAPFPASQATGLFVLTGA